MFGKNHRLKTLYHTLLFGVVGISAGVIIGFIFGMFIAFVTRLIAGDAPYNEAPSYAIGAFLGMGAGAVLGGIFGGVIGKNK